jgi:catechol 1,2-dioxygenase
MRGRFLTDADGRFEVRTTRPVYYQIPTDGPVGEMLRATKRHAWRPAHVHFVVSAEGHQPVTTHIFDDADPYLDSDAVFAVKDSLRCRFARHDTADAGAGALHAEPPYYTTHFDFVLKPAR